MGDGAANGDGPLVGVLALQGGFPPHRPHLEAAGARVREVLGPGDLDGLDGLVLPGGESTTMLGLIGRMGLAPRLREFAAERPVWGVCAGTVLLARSVENPRQESLGLIDLHVARNGRGRQLASRRAEVEGYGVAFIRAPVVLRAGDGVGVLAESDGSPVWAEQGNVMATTFHPELNPRAPSPWHRLLAARCAR